MSALTDALKGATSVEQVEQAFEAAIEAAYVNNPAQARAAALAVLAPAPAAAEAAPTEPAAQPTEPAA